LFPSVLHGWLITGNDNQPVKSFFAENIDTRTSGKLTFLAAHVHVSLLVAVMLRHHSAVLSSSVCQCNGWQFLD